MTQQDGLPNFWCGGDGPKRLFKDWPHAAFWTIQGGMHVLHAIPSYNMG